MPHKPRSITKARSAREARALQEGLASIAGYVQKRQRDEATQGPLPEEQRFRLGALSVEERRALRLSGEEQLKEAIYSWPDIRRRLNVPHGKPGKIGEFKDLKVLAPTAKAQWLDLSPYERAAVVKALDEVDAVSDMASLTVDYAGKQVQYERNPEAQDRLTAIKGQINALTRPRESQDEAQLSATFQAEKSMPPVRGFGSSFKPAIALKQRVISDTGYAVTVDATDEEAIIMDGRLKKDGTWTLRGTAPADPVTRDESAARQEPWTVLETVWMPKKYGAFVAKVRVGGLYNYLAREAIVAPADLIDKKTGEVMPTPLIGYRRAYVLEIPLNDPKTGKPITSDDIDPETGLGRFSIARNLKKIAAAAAAKAVPEFLHLLSIRGQDERERAKTMTNEQRMKAVIASVAAETAGAREAIPAGFEQKAVGQPKNPEFTRKKGEGIIPVVVSRNEETGAIVERAGRIVGGRRAKRVVLLPGPSRIPEKLEPGSKAEAEAIAMTQRALTGISGLPPKTMPVPLMTYAAYEQKNVPKTPEPRPSPLQGPLEPLRTEVWKLESAIAAAEGLLARAKRKPLLEQTPEDGHIIRETPSIIDNLKKKLRLETVMAEANRVLATEEGKSRFEAIKAEALRMSEAKEDLGHDPEERMSSTKKERAAFKKAVEKARSEQKNG